MDKCWGSSRPSSGSMIEDSWDSEAIILMVIDYYSKWTYIKVSKGEGHKVKVRRNQAEASRCLISVELHRDVPNSPSNDV